MNFRVKLFFLLQRAIRTIVLSSFPEKQNKPGPHQMNM